MTTLNQILAVEKTRHGTANQELKNTEKTLDNKVLFEGFVKTLKMVDEEQQFRDREEETTVETTVGENLDYLSDVVGNYFDVLYMKDCGNQVAFADVVLSDGTVLIEKAPATFLLALEKKLAMIRDVYKKIPTLQSGRKWDADQSDREGIWIENTPTITEKTQTDNEWVCVVPGDENNDPVVKESSKTKVVGINTKYNKSGALPVQLKAESLKRIEDVIVAVKKARTKANSVKVTDVNGIMNNVFNYINP